MSFLTHSQHFMTFVGVEKLEPGNPKYQQIVAENLAEIKRLTGFNEEVMTKLIIDGDVSMINEDNYAKVFDMLDAYTFNEKNKIIKRICRNNRLDHRIFDPTQFDRLEVPNLHMKDIIVKHSCICEPFQTRCSKDEIAFRRKHFYCLRRSFIQELATASPTSIEEMLEFEVINVEDLIAGNIQYAYETRGGQVIEYIIKHPSEARRFLEIRPLPPIQREVQFIRALYNSGYKLNEDDKKFIKEYAQLHEGARELLQLIALQEEAEMEQRLIAETKRVSPFRRPQLGARVSPVRRVMPEAVGGQRISPIRRPGAGAAATAAAMAQ
jgi:hypothetical protein